MSNIKWLIIFIAMSITALAGLFVGTKVGEDSGARQMARHILNPQYRTDSFEILIAEETGIVEINPERPTYNEGFMDGLEVSKYPEYRYPAVEEMVYSLCGEQGIDPNKWFGLTCPKCSHATFVNKELEDGSWSGIIIGFLAKPKEYPEEVKIIETTLHCSGCEHLFGSDWTFDGFKHPDGDPNNNQ